MGEIQHFNLGDTVFFVKRRSFRVKFYLERHSRNVFERESRPFSGEIGSPIKTFGDDDKFKL